jgi:hypothetical protein
VRIGKVFPIATGIVVITMVATSLVGAVIGVLSGLLSSLILRIDLRGTWKDALLGAIAVPIGFFLVFITPWPENTVRTSIGGGSEMTETMNRFQHPFLAAFILAAILPALRSLYRFNQSKKRRVAAS